MIMGKSKVINNDRETEIEGAIEVLNSLPEEQQDSIIGQLTAYSGPLPPPEMLANYDKIIPNSAQIMFENSMNESKHRRNLENESMRLNEKIIDADINDRKLGKILGFVAIILLVFAGVYLIMNGYEIPGGILAVLPALAVAFTSGVRRDKPDSNNKNKED